MGHPARLTRDLLAFYLGNDAIPGCSTGWRLTLDEGKALELLGARQDQPLRIRHSNYRGLSVLNDAGLFTDLQNRLERLYQQALRSIDTTGQVRSRRLSDTISTEGITLYLDEASPEGPEKVELVFIQPSGMDRTALLELGHDPHIRRPLIAATLKAFCPPQGSQLGNTDLESDDNFLLANLEDALKAASAIARKQMEANEASFLPSSSTLFASTSQYIELVNHLMRYNDAGSVVQSSLTQALSNPLSAYLWVREQVQDGWKTRFNEVKRCYAQQFAQIRGRKNEAFVKGDDEGKELADRDKRKLNKVIFDECAKEELIHVRSVLQEEERQMLEDVVGIYNLYDAQRAILSAESSTTSELIDTLFEHQKALTHSVETELLNLEAQCETLESALACTSCTMGEVTSRAEHLATVSVNDLSEEEAYSKQLSSHLASFNLPLDEWNDVQTTREVARSLYDAASSIESSLGRVIGQALDVQILAKDCIISFDVT